MLSFFIHSWLTILLLLVYMGMVIVVLLNVLIAQLSYTYSEAKSNAKLQYAIDRMSIIARLEQMTFGFGIVSMIVSFKDRCCFFFTIYFYLSISALVENSTFPILIHIPPDLRNSTFTYCP